MPEFERIYVKIIGDSNLDKVVAKDTKSLNTFEKRLDGMFKKYGSRKLSMTVEEDGAAKTVTALKGVDKEADSLDGRDIDINIDKDGSGLKATEGLTAGFKGLASNIRATGTVLAAASIPFAIAGIGAGIPTIAALSSSIAGLAINLGKAGAGFTLVGGAAYAGARVGLTAYTKVLGSVISGSREAYTATHAQAAAQLVQQRQTILNTQASTKFNQTLDAQFIAFTRLQAAIGNRVFPMFTQEMNAWGKVLADNRSKIVDTASGLARVGVGFTKWFRTAEEGQVLSRTIEFINRSTLSGAHILDDMGRAGVMAFQPLIPMAEKLQGKLEGVAQSASKWAASAAGQKRLTAIYHNLWAESMRLVPVVQDLGTGIFRVFKSIDNAGLSDQASGALATLASGLEKITREGTGTRHALNAFMNDTRELMPHVGSAVMALVGQLGRVAGTAIKARQEGHKLTILQEIFNGIREAAKPLGNLLIGTFKDLGPEIAKLIPNLARVLETFGGSSGPLTQFVRILNRVAKLFNGLPDPIKSTVANLVALKIILGGLGFGAVASAVGRFASNSFLASRASGKLTEAMKVQAGVAGTSAVATTGTGVAATKTAGRWSKLGGILKGAGVALLGFGTIATGGVLAAIAGIAAAGYLIYKNWDRIMRVLAPVRKAFANLRDELAPFAKVLKESFVTAIKAFASGMLSAIVPGKKFGQQIDSITGGFGKWIQAMGPPLQRALSAVSRWLNDNRGTIRTVGHVVGTVLAAGFKIWFKVLQGGFSLIRTFIKIVGFIGEALNAADRITKSSGKGIHNAIAGFTGSGIRLIRNFGGSVVSFWKNRIWEPVANFLMDKSRGMQNTIDNFRQRVVSIIKALGGMVVNYWKNSLWGVVASFLIDRAKGMGTTLENFRSRAVSWVKSLPGAIGKPFKDVFQDMADWAVHIKDGILTTIGNLASGVKGTWANMGSFVKKVLSAVGIKSDNSPIPNPGGKINDDTIAPNQMGRARGGLDSGTYRDTRGRTSLRMARGGIADGHQPRVVYGEAGPEAYVTLGRYTPESAEAIMKANEVWSRKGWLDRARAHKSSPQDANPGGKWGQGYSVSPITHYSWAPEITDRVHAIANATGTKPNTYPGHGEPGGSSEKYTADFWGSGGRGDPIPKAMGYKTADLAINKYNSNPGVLYVIRQGEYWRGGHWSGNTYGDPHYDHTHVSWDSPGGASAHGGGPVPNPDQAKFEKMWKSYIGPWAPKWVSNMSARSQYHRGAGAGTSHGVLRMHDWIDAQIPDMIGGSESLPGGSSPKGLTIGEALSAGGWPDSSLIKASSTVWHESGGNAHAQNPSGARGLMQIMPQTAKGVGASYGKLYDPVYNTSTGRKVYNQAGGWGPWVGAGMGGDYRNKPVTGYGRGGVVPGLLGQAGLALVHSGERILTREQVRSFDHLADSIHKWARNDRHSGLREEHRGNADGLRDEVRELRREFVEEVRKLRKQTPDAETLLHMALRVQDSPAGVKGVDRRVGRIVHRELARIT